MFDIGFSELLLCFIVALVVLGPERLPGVARGIGRATGKARAYMRNLSAELERESSVAELKQQIGDAKRILSEESSAMKKHFDDASAEGHSILGDARRQIEPEALHSGLRPEPATVEPPMAPPVPHHPEPMPEPRPVSSSAPSVDPPPLNPDKHV